MGDPELHPRLEQLLGSTLAGRYRVDGVIGAGGMGIVFSGRQLNLKREVAIKVLDPEVAADETGHRRFAREAQSAGRLDHPNCLAVYDYGTTEGMHYIVMPRLYGRTLRAELTAATTFRRCLEIFDQILAGLEHAHSAGVIHRDLKPANVFLSRDAAGSMTVKLLDFGIAKIVDSEADGSFSTRTGLLFGTPAYMSPEQATGETTDARTDLYSAGIILYRMLTGVIPNAGRSAVDQMRKRASLDIPRLPVLFPERLGDLCESLCAREARDRCPSASAAREELAELLADIPDLDLGNLWQSGHSESATNPDDVTRDESEHRSLASHRLALAVVEPGPGEPTGPNSTRPDPTRPGETRLDQPGQLDQPDRNDRRAWVIAAVAVTVCVGVAVFVARNRHPESATERAQVDAPTAKQAGVNEPVGPTRPAPDDDPLADASPLTPERSAMGVQLLQDITAVNEPDPTKALAFHERRARIAALRSVEASIPLLDERVIAAMDLLQAEQSDDPCETFGEALDELDETDDLEPVMALLRVSTAPVGEHARCAGLQQRLDALTKAQRRPQPRKASRPPKDPTPAPEPEPSSDDLQGKVTPKLGDDELR